MQRRLLAVLLMVGVAVPTVPASPANAAAEPALTAKELYDQGRTAYRLGKFREAVDAWEKSYDLSEGNPLLLYNIALAYNGLFGIAGDIKDLRRAEAVMKSFITVAEADPALEGELADARARREEFLAEISAEEAKRRTNGSDATEKALLEAEARRARDEKRAKKLHLGGAITMGVGGAVFLTGAGLGTFYVVRSGELRDKVTRDRNAVENELPDATAEQREQCTNDEGIAREALEIRRVDPGADGSQLESTACRPALYELSVLAQTRINGKKANTLAIVGFAVIGGIGLAALISGAVVFAQGNRISRSSKTARVQFSPTFGGRAGTGFVIRGRF